MHDPAPHGIPPSLACTVRGCGRPLAPEGRAFKCPQGHSYDIARSGYINLLQPQDRRSVDAGDSKQAVEARSRLLDANIGSRIISAMLDQVLALDLPGSPQVADLGSGSGHLLAAIAARRSIRGVGIDLSTAAVDHAARSHPALTWVVANADRRLPMTDMSTSLVLSMHGRRNPDECARVLSPGGHLLAAIPAADDLIELREAIHGSAQERNRAGTLLAEHDSRFTAITTRSVREHHRFEASGLRDLLQSTYRGRRLSSSARVAALEALDVTLASELVLFRKKT